MDDAPGAPALIPTLTYEAAIEGDAVRCRVGSPAPLAAPVWCFSLLGPARVVSGGTPIRSLAGYAEVQLPDLLPGAPQEVVLAYASGARPLNRAWLPQGGYLRLEDDRTLPLPHLPVPPPRWRAPEPLAPGLLPLVPPPALWSPGDGAVGAAGLLLPEDEALAAVARLAGRLGLPFAAPGGLPLALRHDLTLPPEGFRLDVARGGVTLWAGDRAGRLHGGIALLALLALGGLPAGRIEDTPRFPFRGQQLDCVRHAFEPATILRLLDLMALLRLNRLLWTGAGDDAFRWETETAPDLWRRTAVRGEGCLIPGLRGGGARAGRSYARADVEAVLARARELGIQVIPGLSLPAGAHAMTAALPALRDPEDRGLEAGPEGYPRALVNPAMGATWDVLPPLLAELASWFPGAPVHLGGDGLPEGAWAGSPAVAGLREARGLAGPGEVRDWMLARLAGDTPVAVWDGAEVPGALVFARSGTAAGVAAARAGHDVVMAPERHVRLDAAHGEDPDDWGAGTPVPLEATADWRVVPPGAEDVGARVRGVMGLFGAEAVGTDGDLGPLLLPRLLGVACKAWVPQGGLDGDRLRPLVGAWGPLLDRIGWRWNGGA